MRNIVILRGAQGSGKSRLVSHLGLEGHHLSYDQGRQFASGDVYDLDGSMRISQEQNRLAVALTRESLQRRMRDGELIVFEATLPTTRDVLDILEMAARHRYRAMVVDFFGIPLEECLASNRARTPRTRVPDHAVERCYDDYAKQPALTGVEIARVEDGITQVAAENAVGAFIRARLDVVDLSSYRRIIHAGDLQGTLHPVLDAASPIAAGVADDEFVIFTGDLFDRGVENGLVGRWWMDHMHGRPNVVLIAGNHEDHVEREADGLPAVAEEWSERTMPQLVEAGIRQADLKAIADSTLPLLMYQWRGRRVFCTHGGLSRMPTHPERLSMRTMRKGNGQYGHDIDAMWTASQMQWDVEDRIVQVHGHRNSHMVPTRTSPEALSFNLEGQVEFGGHMRFATLDESGWSTVDIRSRTFRTMVEGRLIDEAEERQPHGNAAPLTPWAREGRATLEPIRPETLAAFQDHRMIAVFQSASMPHVSSVNFTKAAFYEKGWDAYTTVARGLFLDNVDDTVVSRSYPKFWNHGERRETSDEALQAELRFPVEAFEKANGFLCVTGYSERTRELVISSKSRIEGPFAEWAREILANTLGAAGLERLMRFNRDQKASLVFEIVDPVNDPHIIEYAEAGIVLLGCVRRAESFEQADYQTLQRIAKWIGCPVKKRLFHGVSSWSALRGIMDRAENDPNWLASSPIEGLVIQDAAGYQYKVKASFYRDWKRMRGAVERIALSRRSGKPFDRERYADMPTFQTFLDWADRLPDEALGIGIIALRNMWLRDPAAAEAMGTAPVPISERPKDMTGFLKGVDAIAAQIAKGTAKTATVRRMIDGAQDDPDRRTAFEAHPAAATLRAFVRTSEAA